MVKIYIEKEFEEKLNLIYFNELNNYVYIFLFSTKDLNSSSQVDQISYKKGTKTPLKYGDVSVSLVENKFKAKPVFT